MKASDGCPIQCVFSDDLNKELDKVVSERKQQGRRSSQTLPLYLAARDRKRRGLKVGLVQPDTQRLETEDRWTVSSIDLNRPPPSHKFSVFNRPR